MNQLVFVLDGEPVAPSDVIAQETENQHKNVLELIRKYRSDFEEFGRIAFETRKGQPLSQGGFAKPTDVAMLNEQQATLLLTYMRNNDIVRAFKKRLVREFFELAKQIREGQQPAIPQTYAEALQLAADQARQIEQQQAQLEAAKPAVEFTKRVTSSADTHTIDEAAKILRAGPHKLRRWMRAQKFLRLDNTPYQGLMDRGLFRVIEKPIQIGPVTKLHAQTLITGKGMAWLQSQLDRHPLEPRKALQSIN